VSRTWDGSEPDEAWAEFEQERRPARVCQNLANAITASRSGRLQIAASALDDAAAMWEGDTIADHITDAETALSHAYTARDITTYRQAIRTTREHCREAAQLLYEYIDGDLGFKSGGAFA